MLHKLQKDFKTSLVNQKSSRHLLKLIKDANVPKENLLDIYRNNVFLNLTDALKNIYPTVKNIVGDSFFKRIAHEYIEYNLPHTGSLIYYGETFSTFIQKHQAAEKLGYLPEVARFEWFWHECYHAREDTALLPSMLDGIIDDGISLKLRDSVKLFTSKYPIDQIWELSQKMEQGQCISETTDIGSRGCHLLLIRVNYKVEIFLLNHIEHYFLLLFTKKQNLETILFAIFEKCNINETEAIEMLSKFLLLGVFRS